MMKKGFTLLEVIISTIILAMVMAGFANVFVATRRHILHTRSRMTGGELGKTFVDPLQMLVREDTWTDATQNCLGTGTCPNQIAGPAQGLDRNYTATYAITNETPIANINSVTVNITWTEPQ